MTNEDKDIMARLASTQFQEKYIDKGTENEYIIPDELVDMSFEVMKRNILKSTDPSRDRLLNLYVYCEKQLDKIAVQDYKSEPWLNIRSAVRNYLIQIEKFDIEKWEKDNA